MNELSPLAGALPGLVSTDIPRTAIDGVQRETAIAQRERIASQLAGENRLLEMVASGFPLSDVLASLCRFVEETAPECVCGIYLIDWSVSAFKKGAAPSLPADFFDAVEGLPVHAQLCPCGLAALSKRQVVAADLETDPVWREMPFRDLLYAHDLRSVWSTPIVSRSGTVLATFVIYHHRAAAPSAPAQELIGQVTHIASIAIERERAEVALRESEREARLIVESIPGLVAVMTPAGAVEHVNGQVLEYFGRTLEELKKWGTIDAVHPADLPSVTAAWQHAIETGQPYDIEHRIRREDGQYRWF